MFDFLKPKKQILNPLEKRFLPKCKECGKIMKKDSELKGQIVLIKGRPVCTMCRLMKHPKSGSIDYRKVFSRKKTAKQITDDIVKRELERENKEKERVLEIAGASQERAEKINPNTKLNK